MGCRNCATIKGFALHSDSWLSISQFEDAYSVDTKENYKNFRHFVYPHELREYSPTARLHSKSKVLHILHTGNVEF